MPLPDGLVVVVKKDCETCVMVAPVLAELATEGKLAAVVTQDDPSFPDGVSVIDDRDLAISWTLGTEVTPTLYRVDDGQARSSLLDGESPIGNTIWVRPLPRILCRITVQGVVR